MIISASLVIYKTNKTLIKNVIESFIANSHERRLFIIDNSKTSKFKKNEFGKGVEYFFVGKNIGYGKAHNIGIKKALSEGYRYHIIMNPDVVFNNTIINDLVVYMENNYNIGNIMPKIVYQDGSIQYLCKKLPKPINIITRIFSKSNKWIKYLDDDYTLKKSKYDKIINAPCLSGCFMFLNMEVIKKYGILFDERFFMYFEDFDFNRRIHRYSKTLFYPSSVVIHGYARQSHYNIKSFIIFMISAIKYFNKYGWIYDNERDKMNYNVDKEIENINKHNITMV
jgi:hypothetical protein